MKLSAVQLTQVTGNRDPVIAKWKAKLTKKVYEEMKRRYNV